MKNLFKFLLLIFLVFIPFLCYGDNSSKYSINAPEQSIKNRAFNTPDNISENIYSLTKYLTKPFKSDYDKLKVIAYWIASHVVYDGYKYSNGNISLKELNVEYDILKAKTGICGDFAGLFQKMAKIANIEGVEISTGYVLENQKSFRHFYNEPKTVRHAWNKVTLGKCKFFVDTTFMSQSMIGEHKNKFLSTLKHKREINKRINKKTPVNTNIEEFYFDFTPRKEFNKFKSIHVMDKYIRD